MGMVFRARRKLLVLVGLALAGCAGPAGSERAAMLGPASLRINPTFTRPADGAVQADVELIDAFGDPTKGAGTLTLALFEYDAEGAAVKGDAAGEPRQYDLATDVGQRRHWQAVVRTYRASYPLGNLDASRPYVLRAIFTPTRPDSPRLFDELVLRPRAD